MKARVSQLHKTEADWAKWAKWVPDSGELIVYDPDAEHSHARIKVGDGVRSLSELDFFIDSAISELLKHVRFEDVIDGGRITEYDK